VKYAETHFVKQYEPDHEAAVELRNGRFVDVMNGCFFDSAVRLTIKGTTIAAMPGIDGEPIDTTPDYTIDLQGKVAIPGLFNTHCHTTAAGHTAFPSLRNVRLGMRHGGKQIEKNLSECLIHGITNIRDAAVEDLRTTQALRSRIARGEIPGPRILQAVAVAPSGSYLATVLSFIPRIMRGVVLGMPAVDHGDKEAGVLEFPTDADESQVRDAVDRAIDERGAEAIKTGEERRHPVTQQPLTMMTMGQFRALVDQARKRGLQTLMHCTSVDSFRRGVEAGVSSLSHYPFDAALTSEDGKAFVEADCIIEPTISVAYSLCWKIKDDPSQDHPDVERLCDYRANSATFAEIAEEFFMAELRESVVDSYERYSKGHFRVLGIVDLAETFRKVAGTLSHGVGNIKRLYRCGATMALANDGGAASPCTPPMMSLELSLLNLFLNQQADEMVFGGADALRIATINSARSMGLDEQFGTLETGKTADIAIVDGDPFEDLRVIGSRVAALFMDGRMVINNCGFEVEPVRKA
jgi:imidazolonepropionase-like amidohydrolase